MYEPKPTQLSIRLNADEKEAFNNYASHMQMTQRDAFLYLMQKHGNPSWGSADRSIDETVLRSHQQTQKKIDRLEKEITFLQKKLEEARNANPETVAPKMTARYRKMQEVIRFYFQLKQPPKSNHPPLPRYGYKRFMREISSKTRYMYPREEGNYVFFPEALLYGKSRSPVYFWVGRLENGQPCKCRVYEKWDYVGIRPTNDTYAVQKSRWFVSLRRATDGALDLLAALPLDIGEPNYESALDKLPSLDQRLADIEYRRKYGL